MKTLVTRSILLSGTAIMAAALPLGAPPARADECLLDRNNNGAVDPGIDNDGGADSGGVDGRLACGINAVASGASSMAVGDNSRATGNSANAIGTSSTASGTSSTAVGVLATASGNFSTAVGQGATS
ncbi:MAG: hypothetical protein ACRETL_07580, partial [Gammaproteobacteria bacterium]